MIFHLTNVCRRTTTRMGCEYFCKYEDKCIRPTSHFHRQVFWQNPTKYTVHAVSSPDAMDIGQTVWKCSFSPVVWSFCSCAVRAAGVEGNCWLPCIITSSADMAARMQTLYHGHSEDNHKKKLKCHISDQGEPTWGIGWSTPASNVLTVAACVQLRAFTMAEPSENASDEPQCF